jgi:hypothetical protein
MLTAPPLVPNDSVTANERPIDLVHLARTTLGDRGLEREVLHLFDRQADQLVSRMRAAGPAGLAPLAHTLKGSATGIGAWRAPRRRGARRRGRNQGGRRGARSAGGRHPRGPLGDRRPAEGKLTPICSLRPEPL